MNNLTKKFILTGTLLILLALALPASVMACGGLFCQNNPVDQNAERIIFTQNGDGTVSAIIQIQYTGFDEDFSWILPIPHPIAVEDIEVPETAVNAFIELDAATTPVFIAPPLPECEMMLFEDSVEEEMDDSMAAAPAGGVEVFASGEVGPYGFDVIGSDDPDALVGWLRDNNYVITQSMEPLVNVYVEESFVFLAMKLQPEFGVQDIAPIKLTYETDFPMIPLRLTAVAATPDMRVMAWIYSETQAVPTNYAHMEVADSDIIFSFNSFAGHNYRQLFTDTADSFDGRAFITEYAGPTRDMRVSDPLLQELRENYGYVTRLVAEISPEEMTIDPVFGYDPQRPTVSNVHDLSETGLWECQVAEGQTTSNPNQTDPNQTDPNQTDPNQQNNNQQNNNQTDPEPVPELIDEPEVIEPITSGTGSTVNGIIIGVLAMVVVIGLLGIGVIVGRQVGSKAE